MRRILNDKNDTSMTVIFAKLNNCVDFAGSELDEGRKEILENRFNHSS